ncbi:MAG: hypothetical protein HXY50_09020 [Ignavibacteriaceae bacterium]|nr:hypothetical protein [Ignavibacteriaceae bacterium]
MKKNYLVFSLVVIAFFFESCNEQIENPASHSERGQSLSKIISPYYYWTTYTYWDPLYQKYFTQSTSSYSFTFMGYNYSLSYSTDWNDYPFSNYIAVSVNGVYYTTIVWQHTNNPINPRTVLSPWFSVNGQQMNLAINLTEFYIPMVIHSEPFTVRTALVDGK